MIRLIVGDEKPDLIFEIKSDALSGEALSDTIESCVFKLRKPSGAEVSVPLTLVSTEQAKYAGNFGPGDLDEAQAEAPMYGEVVVTDTDGKEQHGERPFEVFVRGEFEDFG